MELCTSHANAGIASIRIHAEPAIGRTPSQWITAVPGAVIAADETEPVVTSMVIVPASAQELHGEEKVD